MSISIGVLSLQGAFSKHLAMINRVASSSSSLSVTSIEVRTAFDLDSCDALILPGGESTTMSKLLNTFNMVDPLKKFLDSGRHVWGTCAGLILLATDIENRKSEQLSLGAIDIKVARNAYGNQQESFETKIDITSIDKTLAESRYSQLDWESPSYPAVFIRAPIIRSVSPEVKILAVHGQGTPVLCEQDSVMVSSFHPELTNDARLHSYFLKRVSESNC